MEILGIGPTELIFIILIAIIVLGPKEMQNSGRTIGRWLNKLVNSDGWKTVRDTSRALRNLPNKLMRDANMEMWEAQQDVRRVMSPRPGAPDSPPRPGSHPPEEPENSIQPPSLESPAQNADEKTANQSDTHE